MSYRSVTAGLAEKRCVLVEALSIVDTLLAAHASEDLQPRSVACTARPHKILDEVASAITADTQESTSPSLQHPSTPNPAPVNVVEQGQVFLPHPHLTLHLNYQRKEVRRHPKSLSHLHLTPRSYQRRKEGKGGHSSPRYTLQQRPKKACEYCRGRFHCRVRAADEDNRSWCRQ
ncbi:hypothetical protein E2C01_100227 [Portunus trituberculatus]|uniref:Uncharacterized protein n=1 Tax=Portunus trituberculatus TaxID=210409 RepID=A0A5B7K7H3_PORTR|nr:hypothetical protein [Portunus trituberculatus]